MEMQARPIVSNFDLDGDSFRYRLARSCRFDDEDLAENKAGKLTSRQMTRLVFSALLPFLGMVTSLIGLVVVGIGLYFFGPLITRRISLMIYLGKYLTLAVGALFFGLVAFIIKFLLTSGRIWNLLLDLSQGKVDSVTGRLTTSRQEEVEDGLASFTNRKTRTFSLVVNGEYFDVAQDAVDVLLERDGGRYRVFVTPRSRCLVSLEPTAADPDAPDPFKLRYSPQVF
jgi:hypothetical protein